jgi:2-polyprenyl-6-hydroxyphenyl methylase/3-demethylubiquinone-9 3-methyltransferase
VTDHRSENIDPAEIEKFESLAHRWWDSEGDFKPLHDINPVRVQYLLDHCTIENATIIDVGCGGGILTESLAKRGGRVTGIDMAESPLAVAKLHAIESGLGTAIRYEHASPERFASETSTTFTLVTCMEMLEHVPDVTSTVRSLADLAAPGADVVMSTINRNPKSYLLAVLGAEYVLNILPRGTHNYEKFIRPSELARAARRAGLKVAEIVGVRYNPFNRRCSLVQDTSVNYLLHAKKLS